MIRPYRFLPCVALLCVSSFAYAQGTSTTSTIAPVGMCTSTGSSTSTTTTTTGSSSFAATISFAARQASDKAKGSTTLSNIFADFAPYVFGRAECDCDPSEASRDAMYMRIQISSSLVAGDVEPATAWVGEGCTTYQNRETVTAVTCRQYTPLNLNGGDFAAGSGFTVTNPLDIYVPARILFSPQTGSCDSNAANSIYIFVGNDQSNPTVTCEVDLAETAVGASPPVNPTPSSGDSAINLAWEVPTVSNTASFLQASYFQVLCATDVSTADMGVNTGIAPGLPVKSKPNEPYYSTCTSAGIQRRQNIFGSSGISAVSATDGGTTVTDGGLSLTIPDPIAEPADTDGGVVDAGVVDASNTGDLASDVDDTTIHPTPYADVSGTPFAHLDQMYVCSGAIPPSSNTAGVRIGGLINNQPYQFVVISVDQYGNATPSAVLHATPHAAEDLYGAYRADGGKAHGFCFVATAAFGDYDHPQVRTLRAFRDRVLEESAFGRAFVRTYYEVSPPLAHFIEKGPVRRFIARMLLWPLVAFAELAIALHSLVLALVVVIGGIFCVRYWRRRRRQSSVTIGAEATA